MFQLEALRARHGDCLLLHWGGEGDRRVALIDGGPGGTYRASLRPRLNALAQELNSNRVPLELMMLSHIDDDHINGLLELAEEIEQGTAPAEVRLLWHNSLEGLLEGALPGQAGEEVRVATASVKQAFRDDGEGWDEWSEKVLASVPQGQHLHAFAKRTGLHLTMNQPFGALAMARPGQQPHEIEGLMLTLLAPETGAVEKLRKAWREKRDPSILAGYTDRSPYNLSSIVVVAEFEGKRMLLTGDALGRDAIAGLRMRGLLDDAGKAHFDLIKLPHHGSQNNVAPDFFRDVTADAYLVSGDGPDGRFPNPHPKAMGWLKEARGDADYVVYGTYDLPYMRDIFGERLRVPGEQDLGIAAVLA